MPGDATRPTAPGGVVVWWATVRPARDLDLTALSGEERARVERLVVDSGKSRSALARVLLRAALADALGGSAASFRIDWEHGPRLLGGGPSLSLSHSADRVVVALSDAGEVGVDIEPSARGERMKPALVRHITTPAERQALEAFSGNRDHATIQLWTAKEAVLKATRDGLRLAPNGLEIGGLPDELRLDAHEHHADLVGRCHLTALVRDPGYVGTLAVLAGAAPAVDERDGDALLES